METQKTDYHKNIHLWTNCNGKKRKQQLKCWYNIEHNKIHQLSKALSPQIMLHRI